jgi:hypothetical protein
MDCGKKVHSLGLILAHEEEGGGLYRVRVTNEESSHQRVELVKSLTTLLGSLEYIDSCFRCIDWLEEARIEKELNVFLYHLSLQS